MTNDKKISEFGNILKQTLDAKGISQKHIADKADTTEATISRYIKGVNNPPVLVTIAEIARELNVSVDYLLGVTNVPTSKDKMTEDEKQFLTLYQRASEDDRRVLWALLSKYNRDNYINQYAIAADGQSDFGYFDESARQGGLRNFDKK